MPVSNLGSMDKELIVDCMQENWMRTMRWWADALHYMINEKGVEVIFSHIHNDDAQKHMFLQFAKENGKGTLPVEDYREFLREEARERGLAEGIQAFISVCQDFHLAYEDTLKKLTEKFSITSEEAAAYLEQYWKQDENEL